MRRSDLDKGPELSPEEVARRIDLFVGSPLREPPPNTRESRATDTGRDILPPEPGRSFALTAVTPDAPEPDHAPPMGPGSDRRRLLWRDSATILIFVVAALVVAQAFPAGGTSEPTASSAIPSGVAVGSLAPGFSLPPGVTFGPIVDPSIGIDATPTPIPAATPSPSPSPTPVPGPTVKPSAKPTAKPSAKPSTAPTPTATPTPQITPAPPTAAYSWTQTAPLTIDFTNLSTGDTSWLWDFGDGTTSIGQSPTHVFPVTIDPTDYQVQLTVSGPGGMDSVTKTVTVSPT